VFVQEAPRVKALSRARQPNARALIGIFDWHILAIAVFTGRRHSVTLRVAMTCTTQRTKKAKKPNGGVLGVRAA